MAAGENYRYTEDARSAGHGERAVAVPGGLHRQPVRARSTTRDGTASGLEILGTKGSLLLRGGTLTFTPGVRPRRQPLGGRRPGPRPLEKAYYDDPKVQAVESP